MSLKIRPIFYVVAMVAILLTVALVLTNLDFSSSPAFNDNLKTIEGARANSYSTAADILETKTVDVYLGDKRAELNILVYEDYANIFSAQLAATLDQITAEFVDKVSLTIRPFIMPGSINSQEAALAYLCAQDAGKGLEMREKLWGALQSESEKVFNLENLVHDLELNEGEFFTCLTNQEKLLILENLKQEAEKNFILGAPTLIVGDEMILGARPYSDFVDSNGDATEGLKNIVSRKLNEALEITK